MFTFLSVLAIGSQVQKPIQAPVRQKAELHEEDEDSSMPPARYPQRWNGPHNASFFQARLSSLYSIRQVNVDANQMNILGDAANEPTITVDPTNPSHIAIAWRQFDSISSNFRQAGNAYSTDGGNTWHNNSVLTPGTFRSDPVLASRADGGETYFSNLPSATASDIFYSNNAGATYTGPIGSYGGDKQWIVCDTGATSPGKNYIYQNWSRFSSGSGANTFSRSKNGGRNWDTPSAIGQTPSFGNDCMGASGDIYVAGTRYGQVGLCWARASQPWLGTTVNFNSSGIITSTYDISNDTTINPAGLPGTVWIAVAPAGSPYAGHVYVVATIDGFQSGSPNSVVLFKSVNNGASWTGPTAIYTNLGTSTHASHWFGTLAVAPNGRIDVVYNDTGLDANQTTPTTCVTMYRSSMNDGVSWSTPKQLTKPWTFGVGYPQQNKIGDYYGLISDNDGADLAFAATFNGEEDVYFMRIGKPLSWYPPLNSPNPP